MHFSAIFLNKHNPLKTIHHRLISLRSMGGGPRTFPGGLNKWQWKRMHEKKAREKENRLLDQEKQVYQARIRSQIRANLDSAESGADLNPPNYGPLSPQEHVKGLADRFMKEGAEDLWNEADGPLRVPTSKPEKICKSIDVEKLIKDKQGSFGNGKDMSINFTASRHFSTYASDKVGDFGNSYLSRVCSGFDLVGSSRSWVSMDVNNVMNSRRYYSVGTANSTTSKRLNFGRNGPKVGDGSDSKLRPSGGSRAKWPTFRHGAASDDDDSDDYDDGDDGEDSQCRGHDARKTTTTSVIKRKKRIPLKFLEDEDDLSQQVEVIRKEISKRRGVQEDENQKAKVESILGTKRFGECGISSFTVQALTDSGYVQMTRTSVQEATISACLQGKDVLVKVRAGIGKRVAFLLPAIETVLKASNNRRVMRVPPIRVLILCPTSELASQISAEANVLLKHHAGIGVQTLVGGTRFQADQRRVELEPCQIIVATPGRLLDHIENKSGISVRLKGTQMLVIDEADHLLDLGFRKDIEKIVDFLPRKKQSVLFAATIPREVRRLSQLVLNREHVYIDPSGPQCLENQAKFKQFYLVAPHDEHLQIVHHLLKSHLSQVPEYKVVVFSSTAMMASLMCSLFREMKMNVREIHLDKPQLHRTRISNEFKESKGLILFTSGVSAQDMSYPDVTSVIQVGIPSDPEEYINRLGITGQQSKEGEGFLLLAPWEQYFLDQINDLPLEKSPLPYLNPDMKVKIEESMQRIDNGTKEAAYLAWLGYYNSISAIARDKTSLVEFANQFSASIGLQKPPALYRKTALKMGLKDIPSIRIQK